MKQFRDTNIYVDTSGKVYIYKEKTYTTNSDGYQLISIGPQKFYVHRLVAEVFLPNPDNLPTVHHKNGNRKDNRLSNLEWMSNSNNVIEARLAGNYIQRATKEELKALIDSLPNDTIFTSIRYRDK